MNRPGATSAGRIEVSPDRRLGTVVMEAGESIDNLARNLDRAMVAVQQGDRVIVICPRGRETGLVETLPERFRALGVMSSESWWRNLLGTTHLAFLPANGS